MKFSEILEYTTKTGQDIKFDIQMDSEPDRKFNNQWVVHKITAHVGGKEAGYLKISYVPHERFKKEFPSLLNFAHEGAFPYENRDTHWNDFDLATKRKILLRLVLGNIRIYSREWDLGWSSQRKIEEMDEDQVNKYLTIADNPKFNKKAAEKLKRFKEFHFDRPLVDYIKVYPEFRRNNIALALYQEGAKWLDKKFGLLLHASGLQQPEAKAAWDKMAKLGWVEPAPGDSSRRVINPNKLPKNS